MNSALEYLASLHPTLANDYRTPDGKNSESCLLIAVEVARRLLAEGKEPAILKIQGEPIRDGMWLGNKTLVPRMYEGRVTWGAHLFCSHEESVYDPMLEKPVSIKDYVPSVFGEGNFLIDVVVSPDRIREFVER